MTDLNLEAFEAATTTGRDTDAGLSRIQLKTDMPLWRPALGQILRTNQLVPMITVMVTCFMIYIETPRALIYRYEFPLFQVKGYAYQNVYPISIWYIYSDNRERICVIECW